MIYKTHHVAALIGAELWLMHIHQPALSWTTAAALLSAYFAGPAADIDQPQSFVGEKLWPLSFALRGLGIRHRTFTHSLLFLVVLWGALQLLPIPDVVRWAIWIGYTSHPFIDLFNEEGVELLWPLRIRVRLLPSLVSIPVDSFAETLLRGGMNALSSCLLFLYLHPGITQIPVVGPVIRPVADSVVRLIPPAIQNLVR